MAIERSGRGRVSYIVQVIPPGRSMHFRDPIPRSALLLGWAGVLPFALMTAAVATGIDPGPLDPHAGLRAYGACILSFLGGVQWGVLLPRDGSASSSPWRYAASVVPALIGFVCLLLPPLPALSGLIAGFLGLLAYDLRTVRRGLAPGWYGSLRRQLTLAVVALLAVAILPLAF